MLTHYEFQIEHVDEDKPATFTIRASSLEEAMKWAHLINPSAVPVTPPNLTEIKVESF
jgi:hypothetical protein